MTDSKLKSLATEAVTLSREIAQKADKSVAAIASRFAGEIYGLNVLASNIEDAASYSAFLLASTASRSARLTATRGARFRSV